MKVYIIKNIVGSETEVIMASCYRLAAYTFLNNILVEKTVPIREGSVYLDIFDFHLLVSTRIDISIEDEEEARKEINRALDCKTIEN